MVMADTALVLRDADGFCAFRVAAAECAIRRGA